MRAARLHEIGGIPRVDEVDEPGGDDVLVVTASSLNPVDISTGNGRFYGGMPDTPYVIGSEAVGRDGDGKRLWYYAKQTMAERVELLQPAARWRSRTASTTTSPSRAELPASPVGSPSSWCANVTPEDTVLVLGASGTLGATAVQGAKLLGARVIGAARRVEAVPEAADEVVALEGDYELPPATVVIDGLWGEPAARALAAAAQGVLFVQLGQSAGASSTLESSWVRGKVARILGHSLHNVPADARAEGYREICTHARTGGSASTSRRTTSTASARRGSARPPAARASRSSSTSSHAGDAARRSGRAAARGRARAARAGPGQVLLASAPAACAAPISTSSTASSPPEAAARARPRDRRRGRGRPPARRALARLDLRRLQLLHGGRENLCDRARFTGYTSTAATPSAPSRTSASASRFPTASATSKRRRSSARG